MRIVLKTVVPARRAEECPVTAPATLRMTPQRQAVLDVLHTSCDHPTAAEVYDRVRRIRPGIGAATVYRTLALLVDSGHALELALGDGASARYDGNVDRHDHVVCVGCGRAVDVETPLPNSAVRTLSRSTGFRITGYDLQFRGRCPDCAASMSTSTTE
jgi:Fur family ferric uptake transcriptional regulator/Fur family peroxide stress response transcriptional regulator